MFVKSLGEHHNAKKRDNDSHLWQNKHLLKNIFINRISGVLRQLAVGALWVTALLSVSSGISKHKFIKIHWLCQSGNAYFDGQIKVYHFAPAFRFTSDNKHFSKPPQRLASFFMISSQRTFSWIYFYFISWSLRGIHSLSNRSVLWFLICSQRSFNPTNRRE